MQRLLTRMAVRTINGKIHAVNLHRLPVAKTVRFVTMSGSEWCVTKTRQSERYGGDKQTQTHLCVQTNSERLRDNPIQDKSNVIMFGTIALSECVIFAQGERNIYAGEIRHIEIEESSVSAE